MITGKAKISDVKSTEKISIVNVQSGAVYVLLGANDAAIAGRLILNGVLAKLDCVGRPCWRADCHVAAYTDRHSRQFRPASA